MLLKDKTRNKKLLEELDTQIKQVSSNTTIIKQLYDKTGFNVDMPFTIIKFKPTEYPSIKFNTKKYRYLLFFTYSYVGYREGNKQWNFAYVSNMSKLQSFGTTQYNRSDSYLIIAEKTSMTKSRVQKYPSWYNKEVTLTDYMNTRHKPKPTTYSWSREPELDKSGYTKSLIVKNRIEKYIYNSNDVQTSLQRVKTLETLVKSIISKIDLVTTADVLTDRPSYLLSYFTGSLTTISNLVCGLVPNRKYTYGEYSLNDFTLMRGKVKKKISSAITRIKANTRLAVLRYSEILSDEVNEICKQISEV